MALSVFPFLISCVDSPQEIKASKVDKLPNQLILDAKFSADGKTLALLEPKSLMVWQTEPLEKIEQWYFGKNAAPQRYVTISENGKVFASASEKSISILTLENKKTLSYQVNGFSQYAKISTIKLSPLANKLFIGLTEGSLVIFDLHNNTKQRFQVHDAAIAFIEPQNSGQLVFTASHDGTIKRLEEGGHTQLLVKSDSRITSLKAAPSKKQLFYSDALNGQKVIDLSNVNPLYELSYTERLKTFRNAAFVANGKKLVTTSSKSELSVWELTTGKQLSAGNVTSSGTSSTTLDLVELNPNQLLTITSDGYLESWKIQ